MLRIRRSQNHPSKNRDFLFQRNMQEAMRVEDGSVRFPDIAAQTTSADTYRHPNLMLSRSKTTIHEPPANYQVV